MGRGKHKDRGHGLKRKKYNSRNPRNNKRGGKRVRKYETNTRKNDPSIK